MISEHNMRNLSVVKLGNLPAAHCYVLKGRLAEMEYEA